MSLTQEQEELSAKLTNLQLRTVLGVVAGKSQRQAYYDAGGTAATDEAADTVVSRMLSDAKVKAFHDSLNYQEIVAAKVTRDSILAELEEARCVALNQEKPQAGAAVAASMGKAKLLGLEAPSKVDHSSTDGTMSPTRIELVAPHKADDNATG